METETPLGNKVLGCEAEALRAIIEMLLTGVLLADADGTLLMHNRAAQEILGAQDAARGGPADWTAPFGWYLSDKKTLISPEELPLVRALRGEEICDHLVFIRHAARPEGVSIRVTVRPMRDSSGSINAAVMVCREVREGRLPDHSRTLLTQVGEQIAGG